LSFFGRFTRAEKEELANFNNSVLKYPEGRKIIHQGEEDRSLYVVLKGEAEVTKLEAPGKALAKLLPGAVFGEVSFISKKPRLSTVTATADALVLKMDQEMMEKAGPAIREKIKTYLLTLLIKRLDQMNMAILEHIR
ncbi:MAG: cyclic nucleotide-binding domain-containing protein, partial [Nitrospinaceae bacterium]